MRLGGKAAITVSAGTLTAALGGLAGLSGPAVGRGGREYRGGRRPP